MKGTFRDRATPLMTSAIKSACFSLSITQWPAIRKRSPAPMRTPSTWNDRLIFKNRGHRGAQRKNALGDRVKAFSSVLLCALCGYASSACHFLRPVIHLQFGCVSFCTAFLSVLKGCTDECLK